MRIDFVTRRSKRLPAEELANESRSTHITVSADMVFSLSNQLSGVRIGLNTKRSNPKISSAVGNRRLRSSPK